MSKDEFLKTLDKKLQVINEAERRDIIDEYRTHIEMKVQDGKSEEEAIEDFGDIDELVDEILDAYKINTDRVKQSFDRKFNSFMDGMYDSFKRFIGSLTSLEVDDVVRLIFEVILVLLILALLHIPFTIVSHIGAFLLRNVIWFGLGSGLAEIWKVVIELAYVVFFIVVIVNVVTKRVKRYRNADYSDNATVFDDFKDSFHFEQAKANVHSKSEDTQTQQPQQQEEEIKEEQDAIIQEQDHVEKKVRSGYETRDDRMRQREEEKTGLGSSVGGILHTLMKIFFCLLMIPFIGIIAFLCCALGAMIVLSVEGFTLIGAYFLVIGGLFVTGAFLSLLYSVLWRRG